MKKCVDIIVGARPNFMKVAALFAIAERFPLLELRLIHTGQHYDDAMSQVFFEDLGIPVPTVNLEVGSGSHGYQTAQIMMRYESWVTGNLPDACVVVGDVNSTLACTLVAVKLGILVAHIEAGLRSFDTTMPEEINRVLTDRVSDLLFVTEPSGVNNLLQEGRESSEIHLVGNVMIDTLKLNLPKARKKEQYKKYSLIKNNYALVTLHRPSNVDDELKLREIIKEIEWLSDLYPVLFTIHPRTKIRLASTNLLQKLEMNQNVHLCPPLSYIDTLSLMDSAKVVVTDSGGIQEETSALGVPCLTLRSNTERPITINEGTNTLIANNWNLFRERIKGLSEQCKKSENFIWDGKAGERILQKLESALCRSTHQ